ncbi:MAG TPA: helix-turn-helix transcriptional regulator [Coriobacteriia bacterium]
MYELSDTVRARRKELGLTLENLAELVGVTPGALSHIESGRRLPDPKNAVAIAGALQLDPDELLTLLDEAHADRRAVQVGRSKPNERRSSPLGHTNEVSDPVMFQAMPIEALFSAPENGASEAASLRIESMSAPEVIAQATARLPRTNVSAPSPRDRARYAPDSAERLRAAEELAEEALRAIRTLRGMLDDEDPILVREARRLLRELDVRGIDD